MRHEHATTTVGSYDPHAGTWRSLGGYFGQHYSSPHQTVHLTTGWTQPPDLSCRDRTYATPWTLSASLRIWRLGCCRFLSAAWSRVRGPATTARRMELTGWVVCSPRWRRRSFSQSFHQPQRDATGAHQLDDASNLSCKDDTRQYPADGLLLSCNRVLYSYSKDKHHAPSATASGRHAPGDVSSPAGIGLPAALPCGDPCPTSSAPHGPADPSSRPVPPRPAFLASRALRGPTDAPSAPLDAGRAGRSGERASGRYPRRPTRARTTGQPA
jgi:hypothetical protein